MSNQFQAVINAGREHPYIVVGGGVLLFILIRANSSSVTVSGGAGQPDPNAALSANTQLQMAAIQGGNQLQLAGVQAGVQLATLSAQKEAQLASIAAERELGQLGFTAQLAGLTAQTVIATETIQAGVHAADLNAQTAQLNISTQGAVSMAQIQQQADAIASLTQAQVDMAWINGDVMKTGIYANRDIAITQSNNSVAIAKISASVAKAESSNGMWGSVIGAGLSMLSDRSTKMNVVELGVQSNGLMLYEYEYKPDFAAIWGLGRKCGYMADEVERKFPQAITKRDGLTLVNYSRLH